MTRPRDLDHAVVLRPRPPFRLDLTVWALRRRGRNRLDRWDGTYRRALRVADNAVTVEVAQCGGPDRPQVTAAIVTPGTPTVAERASIERQLVRMLGLDVDLGAFYALAGPP